MVRKAINEFIPITIIICLIAYVLSIHLKIINIPYMYTETYNYGNITTTMYKYDFLGYIRNIENSFTNIQILELKFPERQWINTTSTFLEKDFWDALINNIALIFDWLYMPINIILYPIRLILWLIRNLLTILGMNYQTIYYNEQIIEPNAIMQLLNNIVNNLYIPYV